MKSADDLRSAISKRLERRWAHFLVDGNDDEWPWTLPTGLPDSRTAAASFATVARTAREVNDWAGHHGLTVTTTNRRIAGTAQQLPSHIVVPSIDAAAKVAGSGWTGRIAEGANRLATLRDALPGAVVTAPLLRAVERYSQVDFDTFMTVARWLHDNDPSGYTPRQVPIPGVHAKWLDTHHRDLCAYLQADGLGLAGRHPARIHFTYLDPAHRAAGHRLHDSATVGDTATPAYTPQVVVICENKDSAIHFPPLPGAVSVEGAGYGGDTAASFPWIREAPTVIYWGDIDVDGYRILDGYRQAGIPAQSILMDWVTFEHYEQFGTRTDRNNQPLRPDTRSLPELTDAERVVYEQIGHPNWQRARRIEQERIPLHQAAAAVAASRHDERI